MHTRYRIGLNDYFGTEVEIDTTNKVMASRLEIACLNIFKEFADKREKNEPNDKEL